MVTAREELHRLADVLPEEEIASLVRDIHARQLADLRQALAEAPFDDEPADAEEEAGVAEAIAQYRRGEYRTLGEYLEDRPRGG